MLVGLFRQLYISERLCSYCGRPLGDNIQGYVCHGCLGSLKPYHPISYTPLEFISSYRIFGLYEGVLSHIIRLVKFKSVRPLAYKLGEAIREHIKEFIRETQPDIVTYVPTHFFRRWRRGFDQNEEILVSAQVDFTALLFRAKYSKPMARLRTEQRFSAVKNAFRVRQEFLDYIESKKILVFDDILTTGATSTHIAELLLSVGALEVHFYFLASEGFKVSK